MGGRGASGGGKYGKKGDTVYGTEYTTLYQSGNIKFIKHNNGSATAPMETRTKGRVYAIINDKNDIKAISYYDKENKRMKQIDLDPTAPHVINGKPTTPHTHYGYVHAEHGTKELSPTEKKMVDRAKKTWYNYKSGKL